MSLKETTTKSLGFLEDLRDSEILIIKALLQWDYSKKMATGYDIATECDMSVSNTALRLRQLNDRGIVLKSRGGSWALNPPIKERLIKELDLDLKDETKENNQDNQADKE